MRKVVIEHDNGVRGQYGFSEEEIEEGKIDELIKSYEDSGILIYNISFVH